MKTNRSISEERPGITVGGSANGTVEGLRAVTQLPGGEKRAISSAISCSLRPRSLRSMTRLLTACSKKSRYRAGSRAERFMYNDTASRSAERAPSKSPSSACRIPCQVSDRARFSRKKGCLSASSRRMATASSMAVSASSRRPSVRQRDGRLFSDAGQVGQERVRARRGQLAADGDGLLDGGQRVLAPAQVRQRGGQVVQRHRQVGQERVRAGRGQLRGRWRRPPRWRPARPRAGPAPPARLDGCSATRPGRAGTRPGGPRPAPR